MVRNFFPNSTASGSPTYPNPTTATTVMSSPRHRYVRAARPPRGPHPFAAGSAFYRMAVQTFRDRWIREAKFGRASELGGGPTYTTRWFLERFAAAGLPHR